MEAGSALLDHMAWIPDCGAIHVQWMELSDLFDHPCSTHTPASAQDVLRRAAQDWLDAAPRPGALKRWAVRTDYDEGAYPRATS